MSDSCDYEEGHSVSLGPNKKHRSLTETNNPDKLLRSLTDKKLPRQTTQADNPDHSQTNNPDPSLRQTTQADNPDPSQTKNYPDKQPRSLTESNNPDKQPRSLTESNNTGRQPRSLTDKKLPRQTTQIPH